MVHLKEAARGAMDQADQVEVEATVCKGHIVNLASIMQIQSKHLAVIYLRFQPSIIYVS